MDWSSFLGGVFASLVGVVATVLSTKKIEAHKAKAQSESARDSLYLELADLTEDVSEIISSFYSVYAEYKAYELGFRSEKLLSHITIPRTINLEILKPLMHQCFAELTREQRSALRSVVYVGAHINELHPKVVSDIRFNRENANVRDIYLLLSSFCAIYHVANDLSLQKMRFKRIEKNPKSVMSDVLVSKGFSIDDNEILKFVEKAA